MNSKHSRRKCRHCSKCFSPDCRNRRHQYYCSKPDCRRSSKAPASAAGCAKPSTGTTSGTGADPTRTAVAQSQPWVLEKRASHHQKGQVVVSQTIAPQKTSCNASSTIRSALQDFCLVQDQCLWGFSRWSRAVRGKKTSPPPLANCYFKDR